MENYENTSFEDIDDNYNSEKASEKVEEEMDMEVKPWYKTSSFYMLITTYILGPLALYLNSKGIITGDQAGQLTDIFASAVVVAIGWVTKQYIQERGDVTALKTQLAVQRSLQR